MHIHIILLLFLYFEQVCYEKNLHKLIPLRIKIKHNFLILIYSKETFTQYNSIKFMNL
jgi:hypothetical protein